MRATTRCFKWHIQHLKHHSKIFQTLENLICLKNSHFLQALALGKELKALTALNLFLAWKNSGAPSLECLRAFFQGNFTFSQHKSSHSQILANSGETSRGFNSFLVNPRLCWARRDLQRSWGDRDPEGSLLLPWFLSQLPTQPTADCWLEEFHQELWRGSAQFPGRCCRWSELSWHWEFRTFLSQSLPSPFPSSLMDSNSQFGEERVLLISHQIFHWKWCYFSITFYKKVTFSLWSFWLTLLKQNQQYFSCRHR